MTELSISLMSAALMMGALTIVALAALRGWSQWIALRRHELDQRYAPVNSPSADGAMGMAASRIDIADLRERIRKLEAIAAGVDL